MDFWYGEVTVANLVTVLRRRNPGVRSGSGCDTDGDGSSRAEAFVMFSTEFAVKAERGVPE